MVNERLVNANARRSVFIQRFATQIMSEFTPYANEIKDKIRLALISGQNTDLLVKQLAQELSSVYQRYSEELSSQLRELALNEAEFQKRMQLDLFDVDLPVPPLLWDDIVDRPMVLIENGKTALIKPFIKDWADEQVSRMVNIVATGLSSGETISGLSKRLTDVGGIVDGMNRRNTRAMLRTVVNNVANTAKEATFEQNPEIVKGHVWVAKLDDRTTDICRDLDGTEFIYGETKTILRPPAHINCRSTISAILK